MHTFLNKINKWIRKQEQNFVKHLKICSVYDMNIENQNKLLLVEIIEIVKAKKGGKNGAK